MKHKGTLKLSTASDREIVMTRAFNAPAHLVFDALTRPEQIKRWLLGPPGWSMPVCEVDLKIGGRYRYVWRHEKDGRDMGMGGVFREIVASKKLVQTEKFDQAWYPGEALSTAVLVERKGKTTLTTTVLYESQAARDSILKSGMEQGVAASYDRLEELLAETSRIV
jgi:uncharacterized protein YndB with AHSA1/START domain